MEEPPTRRQPGAGENDRGIVARTALEQLIQQDRKRQAQLPREADPVPDAPPSP